MSTCTRPYTDSEQSYFNFVSCLWTGSAWLLLEPIWLMRLIWNYPCIRLFRENTVSYNTLLEWICDPEFPQTPKKKSHCLVRWYIRRLKYQKHFPIVQKRSKQEYHWNWIHPYLRSIQVTIYWRVSNMFLLLWVPFQIFIIIIIIWVYIFMFVTSRSDRPTACVTFLS